MNIGRRLIALLIIVGCVWSWFWYPAWAIKTVFTPAKEAEQQYTPLSDPAGLGPDFPEVFVKEDYLVYENCPVSTSTKKEADKTLAYLWSDHIAETFVLCMKSTDGIVNPGVWADHFIEHEGIGLAEGPRKWNGFVWLVIYDPNDTSKVSIHYAIGDGLPAITAGELGPIMRSAEALASDNGIDAAVISLAEGFNEVARSDYQPYEPEEVYFGGKVDSEDANNAALVKFILKLIVAYFLFTGLAAVLSEPFIGLWLLFSASDAAIYATTWPFRWLWVTLEFVLRLLASGSSGSSSSSSSSRGSSGRSFSGGGSSHRSR